MATRRRSDIEPRLATAADALEIGQLLHDFNIEFDTPSPGPRVLADRLSVLLGGSSVFAILVDNPAVAVGLVTLRPNLWYEGPVAILDELYVAPESRDQGIGSAIIDFLHRQVGPMHIASIEINVDEGDVGARRFYERHGYSSLEPDTHEPALYYYREFEVR